MGCLGKGLALVLILTMTISCLSLLIVKPTSAQSVPTPSVPTFTLKFVAEPYYVAPVTTINPYTGQSVTTQACYTDENQSIEITIKNQPFTPFSINGSDVNLSYQIQFKGHYADANSWQLFSFSDEIDPIQAGWYFLQSNSTYTIITVPSNYPDGIQIFPDIGAIDFQVRALIGYTATNPPGMYVDAGALVFHGNTGGWSNTQTVTIGETSASTSSSPTPTPAVPEFSWLGILPLFLLLLFVAVIMRHRKVHGKGFDLRVI